VSSRAKGLLVVGLGVAALSPDALVLRLVKLGVLPILFWRGVGMAVGFLCLFALLNRGVPRRRLAAGGRWTLAIGLLGSLSNLFFVTAITHTGVADTLLILSSSPVLAAVLTTVFLREPIRTGTWAACLLVLAGVAVIVVGGLGDSGLAGDLAAFGGALSTSCSLVVLRHRRGLDPLPGLALGGVLVAVYGLAGAAHPVDARQLLLLAADGLVLLPLGIGLVTRGPRYLPPPEISLMTLLEAALGPLWVWLDLGEQPRRTTVLSGATIVLVLAVHSLAGERQPGQGTRLARAGPSRSRRGSRASRTP
jgi:drug/metabolite transporter (DMT)-like permease